MDQEIWDVLDGLVAEGNAFESRSDVIRTILREWLTANQMLEKR